MSTGQVEEHEQRLVHSDDIELATLEWVWWFNHHRLLEPIGHVPPAEVETQYCRSLESPSQEIEAPESPSLRQDRGGSLVGYHRLFDRLADVLTNAQGADLTVAARGEGGQA